MNIAALSLAELDARADEFAAAVSRALRRVCRQAARTFSNSRLITLDDLALISTFWREHVEADLSAYLSRAYWAGCDHVHGRLVGALTADATPDQAGERQPNPSAAAGLPRPTSMAEQYLAGASNRLVNVGNIVWEQARGELLAGMQAGEGNRELGKRVASVAPQLASPRAEVIARTEVNGASNAGAIDQVRAYGFGGTKTWLATEDNRTREDHSDADGQTVPIGKQFDVGGWPMDRPHDLGAPAEQVVNCRCTLTFDVADEDLSGLGIGAGSLLAAAADVSDGAMIALLPSNDDAKRLAFDGGEAVDQLHLTLFFLGKSADWPADAQRSLAANLGSLFSGAETIGGVAFGANFWNPSSDTPAWVLAVGDVAESLGLLEDVREVAETAISSAETSVQLPDQHAPWVPHICVAYTSDLELLPDMIKRTGPVTFDRVRVAFGTDVTDIQLGGS